MHAIKIFILKYYGNKDSITYTQKNLSSYSMEISIYLVVSDILCFNKRLRKYDRIVNKRDTSI